jgi:hypothetical protein
MSNIIFVFWFCFSSPLLIIPLWIYFSNFLVFCNFKQKPEGLGVEGGRGGGVKAWRAGVGLALVPELEGRAGKRGRDGRRVNPR